jgi:hypothetical protein
MKPTTITLPPQLITRIRRCHDFEIWSANSSADAWKYCEDPEEPLDVQGLVLSLLKKHCSCIEADMVSDNEGSFIADRIWMD